MNREHKIQAALEAYPRTTPGDWWVDTRGEMHNDPVGNVKIVRGISGMSIEQAKANATLLSAAQELAGEVIRLRAEAARARDMI